MAGLLSALVAFVCALASLRRLAWAVAPTALDGRLLANELRNQSQPVRSRFCAALVARDLPWESRLFEAFFLPKVSREARVNEQLLELDWRADRWSRVPRVCASIATSAGFLFACIALVGAAGGAEANSEDPMAALTPALDSLAIGIAGTAACVAVHMRARLARKERLAGADSLADCLRSSGERQGERQ
jgi:hypothetical protein